MCLCVCACECVCACACESNTMISLSCVARRSKLCDSQSQMCAAAPGVKLCTVSVCENVSVSDTTSVQQLTLCCFSWLPATRQLLLPPFLTNTFSTKDVYHNGGRPAAVANAASSQSFSQPGILQVSYNTFTLHELFVPPRIIRDGGFLG